MGNTYGIEFEKSECEKNEKIEDKEMTIKNNYINNYPSYEAELDQLKNNMVYNSSSKDITFKKNLNLSDTLFIFNPVSKQYEEYYKYLFPIGTVKIFSNDTNPNDLYPGTTWEQYDTNRLLRMTTTKKDGFVKELGNSKESIDEVNNSLYGGEFKMTNETMPLHGHTYNCNKNAGTQPIFYTGTNKLKYYNSNDNKVSEFNNSANLDYIPYHYKVKIFKRVK